MTVLLHCDVEARDSWTQGLKDRLGGEQVLYWPDMPDPSLVQQADAAFVWYPPQDMLDAATNLKAVFSLAAGIDHIFNHVTPKAPVYRITDGGMAQQFAEYALYAVLHYSRDFDIYRRRQHEKIWKTEPDKLAVETTVGVLGLGELGSVTAQTIARMGFRVYGWTRTPRALEGVTCFHGESGLESCLNKSSILILCLPMTEQTRGILNLKTFAMLPKGAAVVNLARGALITESALTHALDSGHLRGAMLDVFDTEPLPAFHPWWSRSDIVITPHIAGRTLVGPALDQHVARLKILRNGGQVSGAADKARGY